MPEVAVYQEYPPAPDLRGFVACSWIRKAARAHHAAIPIVPDGCTDVITVDGCPPFVAGPDAVTRWVPGRAGTTSGLRLRPGAARAVFSCDARELLGATVLLADLFRAARWLRDRLAAETDAVARVALLEDWVRQRLASTRPRDHAAVHGGRLIIEEPAIPMSRLAEKLGYGARMLHREFVATCGYSPKHLQRIMRIQNALRLATTAPASLSALAAGAGFADQAHMTRDFRAITGLSPKVYLAQASGAVGRWLDDDWAGAPQRDVSDSFNTAVRRSG